MPVEAPSSATASGARTVFGILLLTLGVIATIGTVLGFFGSVWWAFDVISGYRVQMAALLIIVAVLYFFFIARATAVVFAAAAAVNLFLVVPLYTQSPAPAVAGADELRVVTYDTARASLHDKKVVDWLGNTRADLVFLFESNADLVTAIEEAELDWEIYTSPTEDRVYGITVLSRVEVTPVTLSAGPLAEEIVRAETTIGTDRVAIYATRARRATNEEDVDIRDQTLAQVAEWAADETMPVVVMGPLNASQWSYAFEDLKSGANLTDSMPGFGFQPSWQASAWSGFRIPYDQALHSAQLTTKDRALGPALGSDHLPLVVTFARAG